MQGEKERRRKGEEEKRTGDPLCTFSPQPI
jgi:hypothetical protein